MRYDLLLKGGRVIDPKNDRDAVMDVAVNNGRVAVVAEAIPEEQAVRTLDVAGRIVTPGLVDAHLHVYCNACDMGAQTDEFCEVSGVTTVCDGGSAGASIFAGLREFVERRVATRCRAFVHLSRLGLTGCEAVGELADPRYADVEACVRTVRDNRDLAVGVKVRIGPGMAWDPLEALRLTRQAAEAAGVPFMVHVTDCPIPLATVLAELRAGDILAHCFHGYAHGIFDPQRTAILDPIREAQQRGVVFDSAHGRMGHFSFPVVRRAIEVGFLPDIITTDLSGWSATRGPVFDLATTMSKFLALGMPLGDILLRTTHRPAQVLGLAESVGHLTPGAIADIAVLEVQRGDFRFVDTDGGVLGAAERIAAVMTIRSGRLCFKAGESLGSPSLAERRLRN
jgi:dihydroorotase